MRVRPATTSTPPPEIERSAFYSADIDGSFIKSIDARHLYLDTTGFFRYDKSALDAKTPDLVTWEYYPHWDALLSSGEKTTAQSFSQDAAAVTGHGKAYIVNEFGWDPADWLT